MPWIFLKFLKTGNAKNWINSKEKTIQKYKEPKNCYENRKLKSINHSKNIQKLEETQEYA